MSVTITLALANAYFAETSHIKAGIWKDFSADQRAGAVAHAKRIVSREIGREVTEDTVNDSIYYRPDYAVYEQACFMLQNSRAIANGEDTGAHFTAVDADEEEGGGEGVRKREKSFGLCSEAARYLNRPRQQPYLARG